MVSWQSSEQFAIWIGVMLCIAAILVSATLLLFKAYHLRVMKEKRKLYQSQLEAQKLLVQTSIQIQEEERRRVSLELHDHVVAQLNALLFGLKSNAHNVPLESCLKDCVRITRQISHDLHPPLLDSSDMSELIEGILTPFRSFMEIHCDFKIFTEASLGSQYKLHLTRILQELLSNVVKYANATGVSIAIRQTRNYLYMCVSDDGVGFLPDEVQVGLGLKNISLRSNLMNATFEYRTEKPRGTRFVLLVPLIDQDHELTRKLTA